MKPRAGVVLAAFVCLAAPALTTGCMTRQGLNARLEQLREEHNVVVSVGNPLSRCYLFGYLPGLLDRIDADLDQSPQYFKDNLGPLLIEETFADNPRTYPAPFLMRGYVDLLDREQRFPIHIKNRSLLERVLLWAPRERDLFLHEATHSFEANVWASDREYWEQFKKQFDDAQPVRYGGIAAAAVFALLPPLAYLRRPGMASFYAWVDHWEDVAETHCYLRRHNRRVEFLRTRDMALYKKCRILDRFIRGEALAGEATGKPAVLVFRAGTAHNQE